MNVCNSAPPHYYIVLLSRERIIWHPQQYIDTAVNGKVLRRDEAAVKHEAASYARGTILIPKPPQLFHRALSLTQLDMLLPATITNTYRGAPIAKFVFMVMTVLTVARSLVHIILPDGKLSLS